MRWSLTVRTSIIPLAMEALFDWIIAHGPQSLFVLLVLGIVGLPIPDETLMTFSGYLIWSGRFHPLQPFSAALAGSMCGSWSSPGSIGSAVGP